jgi:release factor glutamine methyltransferase
MTIILIALSLERGIMQQDWTVRSVLDWTKEYFRRKGITAARLEAEILLAHALQSERLMLYLNPERPLTERERADYKALVQRRYEGAPLQYLIGLVDFYGCQIKVSPACLIPRPETEELVDLILADQKENRASHLRILDLGTGTGAIAIALARAFRQARVLAVDISTVALGLAKENAASNRVDDRVSFVESDWYEKLEGKFDLIVSNPPYVPRSELSTLQPEVQREPEIALNGGDSGLCSISQIITQSAEFLLEDGTLYLEIGHNQGRDVHQLLSKTEHYRQIDILRDLSGKDRFARAFSANVREQSLSPA